MSVELAEIYKRRRRIWDSEHPNPPKHYQEELAYPLSSSDFMKNIIFYCREVKRQTIGGAKDIQNLAKVDHNLALWVKEYDVRRTEDEQVFEIAREEQLHDTAINQEKVDSLLKKELGIEKQRKPKNAVLPTDYDDIGASAEEIKIQAWAEIERFSNASIEDRKKAQILARKLKAELENDN